ncbi:MAG: single-stranded DNA-binding protein [Peptococcaceae bacterium]|jgi:single-strand DNA-binding protein|nr:single-stranded DNA-binding protein [Peptococcaceae bacterium]
MLNRVILIGRLTRDPELKYTTPNGTAVATFTLAVDRSRPNAQGEREADFIPIVVWQKQAETCANYLGKGRLVAVDGRMQVRTYEGKDGQRRWTTEVVAENVRFLDKKGESKSGEFGGAAEGGDVGFTDDDIPF